MKVRLPMPLDEIVNQAVRGLLAHRLRATLSSVGIVFGVATVMAALAIGEGARREAVDQVGSLGIDNILVRAASPTLTLGDVENLGSGVPGIVAVAATRSTRLKLAAGPVQREGVLLGASLDWADVLGVAIGEGHWLTPTDQRERRRVMVLGAAMARTLFGSRSPLGQRVAAGGDWYEVVGVLAAPAAAPRSRSPIQRVSPSEAAIVPLAAMDMRLGAGDGPDRVEEITLRVREADEVEAATAAAGRMLARRHPRESGYELVVPRELLRARLRALRAFNAVLLGIGGLALLISGIGIMNIMLASVFERTQEIGVRRAFGATRAAVVAQFAAEAGLLCGVGGIVGVAVGAMLSGVIALAAGWPVSISFVAVVIALTLAVGVGFTFGIYPARLAAGLDPAEALRAP